MHLLRQVKDEHGRILEAQNTIDPKNSVYSRQVENLRKQVREDPNNFYTYSEHFMSLSIDPYTLENERKKTEELHKSKFVVAKGFDKYGKKDREEWYMHPKRLHPAQVEDLKTYAYHEEKMRTTQLMNPKEDKNAKQFKNYLPKLKNGCFSYVSPLNEDDKLTAVEAEKRRQEAKKKAEEEWNKKLIVDDPNFHVRLKPIGVNFLDKYKGLLTDKVVKPSLKMPEKYTKDKIVTRNETLQPLPISFNQNEDKLSKQDQENLIRLDRKYDGTKSQGRPDFHLLPNNKKEFVYKPRNMDVFAEK